MSRSIGATRSGPQSFGRLVRLLPLLILFLAFVLRVWRLDAVPPGLTHDEAAHLHDAWRIWEGARPIYLTSAYGREPLYDYAAAPLVGLAGLRVFAGRLASAFWGTALVALLYAWARRALGRPTALLAAALMALSFWPLSTSRQILRSTSMPVLLMAALLLFWRAVYPASWASPRASHWRRSFLLAGGFLGLAFYTYMPARVTWLIPALLGLSLALIDRPRWRRVRAGLGLMLLTMLLVAAPLLIYLASHPELEIRVTELAAPLQALCDGDPGPLGARVQETLLLLSHRGDVHWMYNVSGRPLLAPTLALLFYLGLAWVLYGALRRRRPAYLLLLIWLLIGVSPALVTGLESSSLRAIAAQPAVLTIAALPPILLGQKLWPRLDRLARFGSVALLLLGLAGLGQRTARTYFDLWAEQRDTRVAYHAHLAEIARYLETHPGDGPVAISTLYPGPFHDPYAFEVLLDHADRPTRWYDARFALLFPDAERARVVLAAVAPLDAALRPLFEPTAQLLERVPLRADDLSPWFEVYAWQPRAAQADLPLSDPVDVGHVVAFVGHRLLTPSVAPGGAVELLTFWRVLEPSPASADSLVLFTHVLDEAGQIVGQQDRLDVPAWNWSLGDLFVQLHRFSLDPELSPGLYPLQVGLYWRVEGYPRLPVYGPEVADHVSLPPLEVDEVTAP